MPSVPQNCISLGMEWRVILLQWGMATCTAADDCEKPPFRRGWCSMHYSRWQRYGDFTTVNKPGNPRQLGDCHLCDKPALARDMCIKHYTRWQRYGDPTVTKLDRDRTPEERFWPRVNKDGPVSAHRPDLGPCWVWTGGLAEGYGMFWLDGRNIHAHIVSFTWEYGDIPEGWERDHLCRNRACVRPDHLEAVTHWTNVARGISPHGLNAAKTKCRNGHDFTPENTRVNSKGQRVCIACARAACLRWYHRQRQTEPVADALF